MGARCRARRTWDPRSLARSSTRQRSRRRACCTRQAPRHSTRTDERSSGPRPHRSSGRTCTTGSKLSPQSRRAQSMPRGESDCAQPRLASRRMRMRRMRMRLPKTLRVSRCRTFVLDATRARLCMRYHKFARSVHRWGLGARVRHRHVGRSRIVDAASELNTVRAEKVYCERPFDFGSCVSGDKMCVLCVCNKSRKKVSVMRFTLIRLHAWARPCTCPAGSCRRGAAEAVGEARSEQR